MKNSVKNSELTILMISDNEADITEVTKQLENTISRSCHLWHCSSVVRSSGFFKKAISEVDIILLDLNLAESGLSRELFRQLQEIVNGIPIIVFTERGEHELALMVVEEGAADNVTKGHFSTDPYKLRDAIEFALAREAISAEAAVALEKSIVNADEKLRQADLLAVSKLENAVEHGENLLAGAKSEAATVIDRLNMTNAEQHREKDQTIHWLSGGYSVKSDPDTSS